MSLPRFTIISPALNSREFLPRLLASVRAQGMSAGEVEHWVIDGGSKDGSVEFLQEQPDVEFISEPDRGLSHAVNKGIERSHGAWVVWLNADDELAPDALKRFLAATAEMPEAKLVCGAQEVRGYDDSLECISRPWRYTKEALLRERTDIIQASTFVRREVYGAVGGMDETHRFAMDYEWMVRAVEKFECATIPDVLTVYHWRRGSIMDAGIAGQHREFLRVRRRHGCGYLDRAELRLRFYLVTEPLRRMRWLRKLVRGLKGAVGLRPSHPME